MNKVIEFLNTASRLYYQGEPIISDEQFDKLAEAVGYASVGANQSGSTKKHYARMFSLQKYYEDEQRDNPLANERDVTMSPKLDGAAVSHLYFNGQYVVSLTRGDGIEGRDITDKFLATSPVSYTHLTLPTTSRV